ncbi:uroporphyrinogen decarboxylase family protein [Candidatus Methanoliparum sp. LAM-1]|uniref:uroporphyrinogen decarboxylase family protein n=1 Tax=Candidatus Methanoliparum sp. LAM-1 TaxID=2874846 RepID=UPI001E4047BA|nr:uroporphyrinogen decarboxylase family protein [Candidatus Methanoliparum sp. LAM-1]BDC35356.1 Uroporphyrinogen_deCOase domain-containing protein [Candidatus Methanoliparum sp. LAM-1]
MTSKKRVLTALNLKEPDRVPVGSFATQVAGKLAGINVIDYATDGEKMAIAQRYLFEKCGFDILFPFSHVGMIAEGWGSRVQYMDADASPVISEYAVKRDEDWKKIEPFDPESIDGVKTIVKAIRLLKEWFEEEVFILGVMFSPITSATHIAPLMNVLKQVKRSPDLLSIGLETITESLIAEEMALEDAGADGIFLAVTRATGELLTRKQYETIAKRWDEKLLNRINLPVILHVCGREPFLDMIVDYPHVKGINWWDRGTRYSLRDIKYRFGDRVCLLGGIDQTRTMLMGTPKDVENEARDAIEQAAIGGGFILFSGCDLPVSTPLKKVQMLALASQKYGKYPIK